MFRLPTGVTLPLTLSILHLESHLVPIAALQRRMLGHGRVDHNCFLLAGVSIQQEEGQRM